MMERLRAGANSLVVKVILSLVILSFLFAGVGSYLIGGSEKPVAVVGNVDITQSQFEQIYQNERQRMQDQAGEMFNSLLADPAYLSQFRSNVLERMVNQSLLDQYAQKIGLRISDERIKNSIRQMPAFLSNGLFSNEQYLATLRRNGLDPEQFAELIRQDLVREQLLSAIQNSEFATENELVDLYKLEEQSRTVRTLTLPLKTFADNVVLSEEQKQEFYKNNVSLFMRPEQFKIGYIELSAQKLANKISVSEKEANDYYQANLARYGKDEQRKVSHIMVEGNSDEQQKKAQAIADELKSGANFADLAKSRSEDKFSAEKGGELDYFDKGVMDPAFEKAAFALKAKGDISDVIKSDFGFHIIKLDDIKPATAKPFAEVKAEITTQLKQQKAADNFHALSTNLAEKAFEMPDNLDEAAATIEGKIITTDFIALNALPSVLSNPAILRALEQAEVRDGLNSEVIEISPEHVIVLRINESRPEAILPFSEVATKVASLLQAEKAEQEMQALATKLTEQLKAGDNNALKASGYQFGKAETITRSSPNTELNNLAFKLAIPKADKPEYNFSRTRNGDILLVALDKVIEPSTKNVNLTELLASRVQQSFANADVEALLGQLKQQINVTYHLNEIEQ